MRGKRLCDIDEREVLKVYRFFFFRWQTCKRKEIDYIRYYDCVNWKWCHLTFQLHSLLNFSIIIDKNFLTYIHQTKLKLNVYWWERAKEEKKKIDLIKKIDLDNMSHWIKLPFVKWNTIGLISFFLFFSNICVEINFILVAFYRISHSITITVRLNGHERFWFLPTHWTKLITFRRGTHPYNKIISFTRFYWFTTMKMLTTMENSISSRVFNN